MIKPAALLFLFALLAPALYAQESSPERAAWETQVGDAQKDNPAYAFVEDDPALPRVLIVGDSISIGYTPSVRALLKGKANVHRIPANAGDTKKGLDHIEAWLGEGRWDAIHFNWGLHDIKRMKKGEPDARADKAISPEAYAENLHSLAQRLQKTGAKLIWAATTPVPEGAQGRLPGDEIEYNKIAAKIMAELKIPIDDLHGYVRSKLAIYQKPADVHYLPEGYAFLATRVAEQIGASIAPKP